MVYYNRTNTCDKCRKDFKIVSGHPEREYDKEHNWTGNWLCSICKAADRRKLPDSWENLRKSLAGRRTGYININTACGRGSRYEKLTCQWRSMVSTISVKNLNIENNNYNSPLDHSPDSELGIIQTKGAIYNIGLQRWNNGGIGNEHGKDFDNLIFYCIGEYGVERIYIFPKIEIIKRTSIGIYKYCNGWYEKYRIKDEKILDQVNKLWQDIIRGD